MPRKLSDIFVKISNLFNPLWYYESENSGKFYPLDQHRCKKNEMENPKYIPYEKKLFANLHTVLAN